MPPRQKWREKEKERILLSHLCFGVTKQDADEFGEFAIAPGFGNGYRLQNLVGKVPFRLHTAPRCC